MILGELEGVGNALLGLVCKVEVGHGKAFSGSRADSHAGIIYALHLEGLGHSGTNLGNSRRK
jgi:hypothetical protein